MNAPRIFALLLALPLVAPAVGREASAAVTDQQALAVVCRVGGTNVPNIPIIVDETYNPGGINPTGNDWGSFTTYTGADGQANCRGNKYTYSAISINASWQITVSGTSYDEGTNRAYWNWVFDGYGDNPQCDYSENCHGYAYSDATDWPHSSEGIREPGGMKCYDTGALSDCVVADTSYGHTIRITPRDCGGKTGWIVESTSEKFRESGVYDQSCTCAAIPYMGPPKGVDYTKGQGPRGGLTFTFLKYVGP